MQIIIFYLNYILKVVQWKILPHPSNEKCLILTASFINICRGGPAPDRLSAALVSRKFAVARARVRGPCQQADVSAAG